MKVLRPVKRLQGEVRVPGDKSISHRAVMFSSLAEGNTIIEGFLPGDDCLSTISCFRRMGIAITQEGERVIVEGRGWDGLREPSGFLDVGNSGTTIRLMMGILSTQPFFSVLIGDDSIAKRPMDRVAVPLREMGALIDGREGGRFTPLALRGGSLKGIRYQLPVASAQVKSALLLAGLRAEGEIVIDQPALSRDHTERMLQAFGAKLHQEGMSLSIKGGQTLKSPGNIQIPGDVSSAAFLMAAAAMIPGSEVKVRDVGINPTRSGIIDVLKQMGAEVKVENLREINSEPLADVTVKSGDLRGMIIEGDMIPRLIDEIPVIAVLATRAEGETVIRDARELKVKESNRIETMVNELRKMGADIEPTDDGMVIRGKKKLRGAVCRSYGDHRVGMSMAVASLVADGETTIEGTDCITVSFPGFFDILNRLSVY